MDEKRVEGDQNRLWEKMGEHDGRIKNLETGQYQQQQANVNLRAELTGNFQRHEDRVENWLHEVKDEILKPMLARVARIEKFIYWGTGGAATLFGWIRFGGEIGKFLVGR